MYLQQHFRKKGNKTYRTIYLAESYRKDGKVKKRYIANLSHCPESIITAIKNALDEPVTHAVTKNATLLFEQGKSFGGLFIVLEVCRRLGIISSLGKDIRQSSLALFQIAARVLCQRSRNYAANEWLPLVAVDELLHLDAFNEDTLYTNLDWLCENQQKIEQQLFRLRNKNNSQADTVYLYDVTSSYFEGTQNELANFGYNRDRKKGKMQIVIGLLCDSDGYPISVEVFEGNTQDTATVSNQLKKLEKDFGIKRVVMVGDRGMIKSASIDEMTALKWHYITAITTPQIKTLLKKGVIQLGLFDEKLVEIWQEDVRYLLRCNPKRKQQVAHARNQKIEKVKTMVQTKTAYLSAHPKASVEVALKHIHKKAAALKIKGLLNITATERLISVTAEGDEVIKAAELDGCYVLKSDIPSGIATKETLHQRYKDLAMVEQAFRTLKQSFEEIQPIYVRKEKRTRGHVFVCMLSYMIMKYIWEECKELGVTQAAIYDNLNAIHFFQYTIQNITIKKLPDTFNEVQAQIIDHLKIKMPSIL